MNLIAACDSKYGIGINNKLPNWKIKGDLERFKKLTQGSGNNVIIMGRNTFLSLPFKPLANRRNIVISKTMDQGIQSMNGKQFMVMDDLKKASSLASCMVRHKEGEVWLIGGSIIYEEAIRLNLVKKAFITKLDNSFECDTFLGDLTVKWIENNDSLVEYTDINNLMN